MSGFKKEESREQNIQHFMNGLAAQRLIKSLLIYKNKIKTNDISDNDLSKIAALLFELGLTNKNEFEQNITDSMDVIVNDIRNISNFQDIAALSYATKANDVLYKNILEGIIKNYTTAPFSLYIPDGLSHPNELLDTKSNNLEELVNLEMRNLTQENLDDYWINLRLQTLISHHKYFLSRFLCSTIFQTISEFDSSNSLYYLLQDIFTDFTTVFYNKMDLAISNYSKYEVENKFLPTI